LGWCLFEGHKFKDALEYFKILDEKYPQEPQARDASFKIIECLYNLKDYPALKEKIIPGMETFSRDSSRMAYLYFYAAEADYYSGNFRSGLAAYSRVLAGDLKAGFLIRAQALIGKATVFII